jgi:hypothetical protein
MIFLSKLFTEVINGRSKANEKNELITAFLAISNRLRQAQVQTLRWSIRTGTDRP